MELWQGRLKKYLKGQVKKLLEEMKQIEEVVDEAETGEELLQKARGMDLSLALLDISLPGKGGLEILKQLREDRPKLPVLILTVYPEEHYAVRFFKAGASGFITKESSTDEIYAAVRKVAAGGKFASPEITEKAHRASKWVISEVKSTDPRSTT